MAFMFMTSRRISTARLLSKMAAVNKRQQLLLLLILRSRLRQRNEKYKKSFWVRPLFKERVRKGEFHLLVNEMKLFDHEYFFRNVRMSPETFKLLFGWIAPFITKSEFCRPSSRPDERLSLTMAYLGVTGKNGIL